MATASWLSAQNTVTPDKRLPNVVIINCDDMGYGDPCCFGGKGYTTPNLDRMAAEGRKFTQFYVAQPVCSASRAALLTGCYPNRVGITGALMPHTPKGLSLHEETLPEIFALKGYATGIAGKWHLGDQPQFMPTRQGFQEYLGIPYSGDMWPHTPGSKHPPLRLFDGEKVITEDCTAADQELFTTRFTERAVSFIDKHKDQPFFFYLAPNQPHIPLFVSDKFKGKSKRGLYGDVMMEIDWAVGEVLAAIKRNGIDENTLVVFTSDNGPWLIYGDHAGSSGPLREGKGTCWEGGVRVPAIMRWPGKIPAGSVQDTPLMTIDLLPTLAKLIGASLPERKIDGLDCLPLLTAHPKNKAATNPHEAYFLYYETNELQAVVSGDGRWKLQFPHRYRKFEGQPYAKDGNRVNYATGTVKEVELYDLTRDESESHDVAKQNPAVVQRLSALADTMRKDLGDSLHKEEGSGRRNAGSQ